MLARRLIYFPAVAVFLLLLTNGPAAADPVSAISPDGRVRIDVSLLDSGGVRNVPHYRVRFGEQEVVAPSRLGVELADGMMLGGTCEIAGSDPAQVNEEFTQVTGKRRLVTNRAGEAVVHLRETGGARHAKLSPVKK